MHTALFSNTIADDTENVPTQKSFSFSFHSDISLFQGMENYLKGVANILFYWKYLHNTHLIKKDLPRPENKNVSDKNSKQTRHELAMMSKQMADSPMDIKVDVTTIKEISLLSMIGITKLYEGSNIFYLRS